MVVFVTTLLLAGYVLNVVICGIQMNEATKTGKPVGTYYAQLLIIFLASAGVIYLALN